VRTQNLLFFSILFALQLLGGCRSLWESPSIPTNNGPIVETGSFVARTTGLFLFELSPVLREKDFQMKRRAFPPECKNRNQVTEKNAEKCGFRTSCSGSLVRDNFLGPNPVVVTAAHCQLNFAFDEVTQKIAGALSPASRKMIGKGETKTSYSRRINGAGRLWFYVPATKQWLEVEAFVPHPNFVELSIGDEDSFDVAAATLVAESASAVKDALAVDYQLTSFEPKESKVKSEIFRLANLPPAETRKNDQMSNFKFDLGLFSSNPELAIYGYGILNRFMKRQVMPGVTAAACAEQPNFAFSPEKGCEELIPVAVENQNLPLRSVTLKAAMLNVRRHYMLALPRKQAPDQGVCYGDSGGPVFKSDGKLLAVVSGGSLPCSGGVSFMTLVATHVEELGAALKDPRSR